LEAFWVALGAGEDVKSLQERDQEPRVRSGLEVAVDFTGLLRPRPGAACAARSASSSSSRRRGRTGPSASSEVPASRVPSA
jgi:hypothetical protein